MGAKPKQKNLLARRCGEGPPIAPNGWKWRTGRRPRDMYFTAPDGSRFRSRKLLNEYLKNMSNAPREDEFCWSITEEVLKHPALQAFRPTATLAITAKQGTKFKKKGKPSATKAGRKGKKQK